MSRVSFPIRQSLLCRRTAAQAYLTNGMLAVATWPIDLAMTRRPTVPITRPRTTAPPRVTDPQDPRIPLPMQRDRGSPGPSQGLPHRAAVPTGARSKESTVNDPIDYDRLCPAPLRRTWPHRNRQLPALDVVNDQSTRYLKLESVRVCAPGQSEPLLELPEHRRREEHGASRPPAQ